jgi:hypothetical protein
MLAFPDPHRGAFEELSETRMKWKICPAWAFARANVYAAVIFITIPVVLAGLILVAPHPTRPADFRGHEYLSIGVGQDVAVWVLLVAISALSAAAFGAAFTIMVGWRSDRRQVSALRRDIDQLELQIACRADSG